MFIRAHAPLVAVCRVTACVQMAGKPAGYGRVVRPHGQFLVQACRERNVYLIVYVNRTIYIAYIIHGRIKAYINGIIGLFLVLQPSISTTIGASDQDPLLSTGGRMIGEGKISQDTRIGKINTDLYIIHNEK